MKGPVLSSLLLLIGLSSQLPAIERPKALDDIRPNEHASRSQVQEQGKGGAQVPNRLPGQDGDLEPEAIPQVKQAPQAWLGVLSEPIDETLGVHLDLESGVVLDYVAPDSPAEAAGLLQHDIVVKVDGEPVGDQDELREAIQTHDPGVEVTLTVVSKGEEVERKVKLGERPAAVPQLPRGKGPARAEGGVELPGGLKFEDLENLPELEGLKDFRGGADMQKQLEGHMKRLEKQLQDINRKGGAGMKLDFDLFKDLQKPQKGEAFNFNFKSS
ncbi:MAG: S1C family serine protease, partial [Akkermansiaceae bacterium]